jgi:hypothetical protein
MMMEAARTSETSADNYFTRQYIPDDNSELQEEDYFFLSPVPLPVLKRTLAASNREVSLIY